jgi:hypothetical protein
VPNPIPERQTSISSSIEIEFLPKYRVFAQKKTTKWSPETSLKKYYLSTASTVVAVWAEWENKY